MFKYETRISRNAAVAKHSENMVKPIREIHVSKIVNHDGQAVIYTGGFPQPEICFILTHKKLKHLAKESSGLQDKVFWRRI